MPARLFTDRSKLGNTTCVMLDFHLHSIALWLLKACCMCYTTPWYERMQTVASVAKQNKSLAAVTELLAQTPTALPCL